MYPFRSSTASFIFSGYSLKFEKGFSKERFHYFRLRYCYGFSLSLTLQQLIFTISLEIRASLKYTQEFQNTLYLCNLIFVTLHEQEAAVSKRACISEKLV